MILRISSALSSHQVGVVEPDESFTNESMQRKRIVNAMRLLGRHRDSSHHEFHPMTSGRIHNQNLPIEIRKHIKRWVMSFTHLNRSSGTDNYLQRPPKSLRAAQFQWLRHARNTHGYVCGYETLYYRLNQA